MKLLASVNLKMKKVILPQFISTLYKNNINIDSINLIESDGKWEEYNIEIVHSSKKELTRLIDSLKKNTEYFREISVTSTLEDKIRGGILTTTGRIDIECINDIWSALIGGNKLIHEKIESGLQKNYCACFNSIALVGGIKTTDKSSDYYYKLYADSERDSVLIGRFTGKNSYPLMVKYSSIEDMIKTIKSVEENFCCIRIMNNDEDDYLFSNIIDAVTKPLVFRELDEFPVHYLSVINTLVRNHDIIPGETPVGIIGLNNSSIRLTSLLVRSGFMKVLGYDHSERRMMSFESRMGLATSLENVVLNSDILLILDEKSHAECSANFRAGQIIISGISDDIADKSLIKEKGLKEYITIDESETLSLLPSMINGIISSSRKFYSDEMLIDIASLVSGMMRKKYDLPNLFSGMDSGIQNLILKEED